MSVSEVLGTWLVLSLALAGIFVGVSMLADQVAFRRQRVPDGIPSIRPPMPRRYAGCIECEAAETLGRQYLIRHQERDHAAGVTW
jgi:hypothetical protein